MPPHASQGFPNRGRQVWGQFGQSGQKQHENFKIGLFGPKKRGGGHGEISQFLGVVGDPP